MPVFVKGKEAPKEEDPLKRRTKEIHISGKEIHISLREIHIFPRDLYISPREIRISLPEICISSRETAKPTVDLRAGPKRLRHRAEFLDKGNPRSLKTGSETPLFFASLCGAKIGFRVKFPQ